MIDAALLILRVALGLVLAAHGCQKLFGWFGGPGLSGVRRMMRGLDVHPSIFWAWVSAVNEFAGGLLTVLGLLMPLGPLMIFASMIVAVFRVHSAKGFWNTSGGYEYPLVLLVDAFVLGLIGPGLYSVDAAITFAFPEPAAMTIGLLIVMAGFAIAMLSGRLYMRLRGRAQQPSHP